MFDDEDDMIFTGGPSERNITLKTKDIGKTKIELVSERSWMFRGWDSIEIYKNRPNSYFSFELRINKH